MADTDTEWMRSELDRCGAEEKKAFKRLLKAQEKLAKAKAEFALAHESLLGIRGVKTALESEIGMPPAQSGAERCGSAVRELRAVMLTRNAEGSYVFSEEEYSAARTAAGGLRGKSDGERLAALNDLLEEKKKELRERLAAHAGGGEA